MSLGQCMQMFFGRAIQAALFCRPAASRGRPENFQFCNPMDAYEMVKYNPAFPAYMPCRIALVEAQDGRMWLR